MKKILTTLFLIFTFTILQASALNPSKAAVELYNAGIDWWGLGNVEKSIDSFKKAIIIEPKFYEAFYNLAQVQSSSGKLDEAIETYRMALNINPSDVDSIFGIGSTLYKRGYLKESLSYLDRVPGNSEYYTKAQGIVDKILTRQGELEKEAVAKNAAVAAVRSTEPWFTGEVRMPTQHSISDEKGTIDKTPVGKSVTYTGIPNPSGTVADALGNIYIASYSENVVYKIDKDSTRSVFVASDMLGGPIGLAVDGQNNVYVANYTKNNILKVTPSGVATVFLTLKKPYCLYVNTLNGASFLYVTEQENNTTIKFPLF
ncbi:serine/threonine protein kinase [Candidatus Gastranaerophilus sp. (ex Termes propinquus)]|nr:serine/threonine protein kinase [Candidatus Gastranaerophilus sp. (ex Termes propinquus)]